MTSHPPQVPAGYLLEWLEDTDSTNAHALRKAKAGPHEKLWIVAQRQTHGRGRRGRTWIGKPGNLFATLLLPWHGETFNLSDLSFVAAVACADMLATLVAEAGSDVDVALKWPNDVLLNGAKVGGILLETHSTGDSINSMSVAIGIGLNVADHPTEALNYPTTDFAAHGIQISAAKAFELLNIAFDKYLSLWQGERGFGIIKQCWLDFGPPLGQVLSVNTGRDVITGSFAGLEERGGLMLALPNGRQQTLLAGDVIVGDGAAI